MLLKAEPKVYSKLRPNLVFESVSNADDPRRISDVEALVFAK